ncbi:MAG: extracellular solute-binding protein [Chloroflexi bacterium]|nr:extracellular solute-binding protein [Chloroflexota bacterium]
MQRLFVFAILLLLTLAAGCSLLNNSPAAPGSTPTPELIITPTNTPDPIITPDLALSAPLTKTKASLTIWLPPEIWGATESGQAVFNAQMNAYRASNPDLDVNVESKSVSGQGSILNYLRTGRTVAPAVLPDLVALPTEQLSTAVSEDLIFPLNTHLDTALIEDLYPAGQSLVLNEEQILGYPFALNNLPHLAYDSTQLTNSVPITWAGFIQLPEQHFVFPAAGQEGATLALELYLAAGGAIVNEAGQQELQLEPLVTALQQISVGRENGFILSESSNIHMLEDSWLLLQTGQTSFVQTSANQYLRQQNPENVLNMIAIPGLERPLIPLVTGWAWAISASDSNKQTQAADLLAFLVAGENLGEWSYQSNYLPARQTAFNFWPTELPFIPFAQSQLLIAEAHPFPTNNAIMNALSNAVFDVVSLAKSPQVAAEEALTSLQEQ